ncbi:MAG: polysaccharide deacetylase [Oscillospiraceae bacterium]|jgi:peptidoglycan/xylan/chitin deacetylase (PgdA/CDA1 family)|nr:polysaccharide deacetylase [Oscillospiraceae bacterium]
MKRRAKLEWMAIYIAAALLVLAMGGLFQKTVVVNAEESEPYPNLYAPVYDGDVSAPEGVIYLTFDDGPSKNTEKLLDVLWEENVKATFFVTAQEEDTEYLDKLLRRIVDEGHELALHSYTHTFHKIYKSADAYIADINKLNDHILEATGYRPSIIRFPGGSRTSNCPKEIMNGIIKETERRGYVFFDWDVVSGDDTSTVFPAEQLANTMVKGCTYPKSTVILAHDSSAPKTTPEAIRITIEALREQGYTFSVLSPGVKPVHIH